MQRRWMSSAPNLLAALQAKGTVLHVELKAANQQFHKQLQEAEQTEKARVEKEECLSGHMQLAGFRKALRSGTRAHSLMYIGRLDESEKQALASLRYAREVESDYGVGLTLDALRRLVSLYAAQSRFRDAEPFARELVDRQTLLLGPKHPMTLEPMQSLATVMASDGRFRQATDLLQTVHDTCVDIYGESHPATQQVASRLQSAISEDAAGFTGDRAWLDRFVAGLEPPPAPHW